MIQDITPAKNWMQESYASFSHALIGLSITKKQIPVQVIESEHYLGTTDGQSYHLNPRNDEAINDWSEPH